jgi:hypothetical protein
VIAAADIATGIRGAWRLAWRREDGMALFDDTPQGYWQSFWAFALVMPGQLLIGYAGGLFSGPTGMAAPLAVQVIATIIDAVAFPLAMATVADEIGRRHNYIRFIIAYNWSAVIRMGLFVPAIMLAAAFPGLHPLLLAVIILLLVYQTYIARTALEVSGMMAGGIVLLNVLLDMAVGLVARQLMGL